MREKHFVIKYRYSSRVLNEDDEQQQQQYENDLANDWYAIDLSHQINEEELQVLTFQGLVEELTKDHAEFNENNIKIKEDIYWVSMSPSFQIDFVSNQEDDWEYSEIALLLQRANYKMSDAMQEQQQQQQSGVKRKRSSIDNSSMNNMKLNNLQNIQEAIEDFSAKQNEMLFYIQNDIETKLRDFMEESVAAFIEYRIKATLEDTLARQLAIFATTVLPNNFMCNNESVVANGGANTAQINSNNLINGCAIPENLTLNHEKNSLPSPAFRNQPSYSQQQQQQSQQQLQQILLQGSYFQQQQQQQLQQQGMNQPFGQQQNLLFPSNSNSTTIQSTPSIFGGQLQQQQQINNNLTINPMSYYANTNNKAGIGGNWSNNNNNNNPNSNQPTFQNMPSNMQNVLENSQGDQLNLNLDDSSSELRKSMDFDDLKDGLFGMLGRESSVRELGEQIEIVSSTKTAKKIQLPQQILQDGSLLASDGGMSMLSGVDSKKMNLSQLLNDNKTSSSHNQFESSHNPLSTSNLHQQMTTANDEIVTLPQTNTATTTTNTAAVVGPELHPKDNNINNNTDKSVTEELLPICSQEEKEESNNSNNTNGKNLLTHGLPGKHVNMFQELQVDESDSPQVDFFKNIKPKKDNNNNNTNSDRSTILAKEDNFNANNMTSNLISIMPSQWLTEQSSSRIQQASVLSTKSKQQQQQQQQQQFFSSNNNNNNNNTIAQSCMPSQQQQQQLLQFQKSSLIQQQQSQQSQQLQLQLPQSYQSSQLPPQQQQFMPGQGAQSYQITQLSQFQSQVAGPSYQTSYSQQQSQQSQQQQQQYFSNVQSQQQQQPLTMYPRDLPPISHRYSIDTRGATPQTESDTTALSIQVMAETSVVLRKNNQDIKIQKNQRTTRIGQYTDRNNTNSSVMFERGRHKGQGPMTDMTIMYSEPLVKFNSDGILVPAGQPVEYELEIQKVTDFLKEANKQMKLDIVVASLDNLEKAINRNSQVLHIMCHGDYSEKDQNYYLSFEDEESRQDPVTSKRFKEFFRNKNSNVKLVFFNACHSEEVGKIFQEAGIPFVIAVQQDLKIEDKAALTFSASFYLSLFSGRSVLESFQSAKSSLQAKQHEQCFTCCCAHSHDDNCLWFIEAMNGFDRAHEQHKPGGHCKCPNAKKMFHEYSCQWAHQFLSKYKENYEDYIENLQGGQLFVCCCHTQETPHDESLKFRLIRNHQQDDCTLMANLQEGHLVEKSNLNFNHPIFQDQCKIFGRNLEVYKLYKCLMANQKLKTRFVGIHGEIGLGKSAIAKKVALHLKERGQVSEIILEDFEKMKTKITKFEQKMRLGQHTKELAFSMLKGGRTLFILDNCDDLIKNNKSKFESTLNELAANTSSKFILISREKQDLKLGIGAMPSIVLGYLNDYYVRQIIEFYAGEAIRQQENKQKFNLQLTELVKVMPKSPKTIMETVQNITENIDIQQLIDSFKRFNITDKQKDYSAFNLLLNDLKTQNLQAYDMLLLISLFPSGVSVEDLKFLEKKKKIPHDWISIMEYLTLYSNEGNRQDSFGTDGGGEPTSASQLKTIASRKRLASFTNPHAMLNSLNNMQISSSNYNNNNNDSRDKNSEKGGEDSMEEDDFDNDPKHEEKYRINKFGNGQYFWMTVQLKFKIVVFRLKNFVVEQLKQPIYREDLFPKEILILEYLSIFAKKLLHNLHDTSHRQEKMVECSSLSRSGVFGAHYVPIQSQQQQHLAPKQQSFSGHPRKTSMNNRSQALLVPSTQAQQQGDLRGKRTSSQHLQQLTDAWTRTSAQQQQSSQQQLMSLNTPEFQETGDSDYDFFGEYTPDSCARGLCDYRKNSLTMKDSPKKLPESINAPELNFFKLLSPSEIFKLHEGNFYSYLNVEDHRQLITYINSKQCNEKKRQKIKRNISDLSVNIPSIHKLLDELSTYEEQCVQAEQVLDELLKSSSNSQFLVPKMKLLFLKISLYVDRFISIQEGQSSISIEDVIHFDEIDNITDEIDKKFPDFDKNEIFSELVEIQKQYILFFLLYQSFKKNKDNDQQHIFEQVLKLKDNTKSTGVKLRVNQLLGTLIPDLLNRLEALKQKEANLAEDAKDIKLSSSCLEVLESKIQLLNGKIELEFTKKYNISYDALEQAISIFERFSLYNLAIQTTMVYCKKKLLESSRDTQALIKLKKEMIDPAIVLSKQWKLTSLEADCKKILGEINDQLHHISSNVFQFMKSAPLMMDKNTSYGHIIRLNQSFKKRITDVLSKQGKELNLKFEIQTIKHFRECLQRGSKFMCISCDEDEDDGIVVEDDQLPLMRKYKEQEMEEYYKQHYEEFGQIEILMLCSPNGIKLKDMFIRIIDKVNQAIKKMQENPDRLLKFSQSAQQERIAAGDSELRRVPTIIAFQFKSTGKKQTQPIFARTEKRRLTLQFQQREQLLNQLKEKQFQFDAKEAENKLIDEKVRNILGKIDLDQQGQQQEQNTENVQLNLGTTLGMEGQKVEVQDKLQSAEKSPQIQVQKQESLLSPPPTKSKNGSPKHSQCSPPSSSSINKRSAKNGNQADDGYGNEEFDDFYLYYLKEFATQKFQFEFVTQLLQDKQDSTPHQHIKKAFNLAQQKMVTETIRICGEDIKDEQTFEQILGKGPELFLSDSWKDAKYEFRKGQIIDITSERPPQNLNRNFLRISGRKQDIFILLQKIQENSVNIFGPPGIGKTIVAQQIAYFTFSRNTFSDGVYYFSLKELVNFNYDLKQYMESLLGIQFNQSVSEYFESQKNMLLIFDDFDIVVSSQPAHTKIKFFEYIFFYINKYDIHYILITRKSLRHIFTADHQSKQNDHKPTINSLSHTGEFDSHRSSNSLTRENKNSFRNTSSHHIKSNMYYHEVKPFNKKEALNFLDSLLDLEQINIKNLLENRSKFRQICEKGEGNPKRLIEEYCEQFGNPKIPQQFKVVNYQHCSLIPPQPQPMQQSIGIYSTLSQLSQQRGQNSNNSYFFRGNNIPNYRRELSLSLNQSQQLQMNTSQNHGNLNATVMFPVIRAANSIRNAQTYIPPFIKSPANNNNNNNSQDNKTNTKSSLPFLGMESSIPTNQQYFNSSSSTYVSPSHQFGQTITMQKQHSLVNQQFLAHQQSHSLSNSSTVVQGSSAKTMNAPSPIDNETRQSAETRNSNSSSRNNPTNLLNSKQSQSGNSNKKPMKMSIEIASTRSSAVFTPPAGMFPQNSHEHPASHHSSFSIQFQEQSSKQILQQQQQAAVGATGQQQMQLVQQHSNHHKASIPSVSSHSSSLQLNKTPSSTHTSSNSQPLQQCVETVVIDKGVFGGRQHKYQGQEIDTAGEVTGGIGDEVDDEKASTFKHLRETNMSNHSLYQIHSMDSSQLPSMQQASLSNMNSSVHSSTNNYNTNNLSSRANLKNGQKDNKNSGKNSETGMSDEIPSYCNDDEVYQNEEGGGEQYEESYELQCCSKNHLDELDVQLNPEDFIKELFGMDENTEEQSQQQQHHNQQLTSSNAGSGRKKQEQQQQQSEQGWCGCSPSFQQNQLLQSHYQVNNIQEEEEGQNNLNQSASPQKICTELKHSSRLVHHSVDGNSSPEGGESMQTQLQYNVNEPTNRSVSADEVDEDLMNRRQRRNKPMRQSIIQEYADEEGDMLESGQKKLSVSIHKSMSKIPIKDSLMLTKCWTLEDNEEEEEKKSEAEIEDKEQAMRAKIQENTVDAVEELEEQKQHSQGKITSKHKGLTVITHFNSSMKKEEEKRQKEKEEERDKMKDILQITEMKDIEQGKNNNMREWQLPSPPSINHRQNNKQFQSTTQSSSNMGQQQVQLQQLEGGKEDKVLEVLSGQSPSPLSAQKPKQQPQKLPPHLQSFASPQLQSQALEVLSRSLKKVQSSSGIVLKSKETQKQYVQRHPEMLPPKSKMDSFSLQNSPSQFSRQWEKLPQQAQQRFQSQQNSPIKLISNNLIRLSPSINFQKDKLQQYGSKGMLDNQEFQGSQNSSSLSPQCISPPLMKSETNTPLLKPLFKDSNDYQIYSNSLKTSQQSPAVAAVATKTTSTAIGFSSFVDIASAELPATSQSPNKKEEHSSNFKPTDSPDDKKKPPNSSGKHSKKHNKHNKHHQHQQQQQKSSEPVSASSSIKDDNNTKNIVGGEQEEEENQNIDK